MSTDCQAGGTSMRMACMGSRPPASSTSSMLSSDWESEPVRDTSGRMSPKSGKQRRFEQRTARHRPAAVALHGVDLAVVRQVPIRMRKPPLRQGVGGKALVKYHHRGFHARILEIGIELRQKLRHDHALVDDGAGRERRQVENRIVGLELFLAAPARHEQFSVEGGLVDVWVRVHEDLLDDGQALQRLRTAGSRVRGQRAKSGDVADFRAAART